MLQLQAQGTAGEPGRTQGSQGAGRSTTGCNAHEILPARIAVFQRSGTLSALRFDVVRHLVKRFHCRIRRNGGLALPIVGRGQLLVRS